MSIFPNSSKLFKNKTKYYHQANIFDEFCKNNTNEKLQSFNNNDLKMSIKSELKQTKSIDKKIYNTKSMISKKENLIKYENLNKIFTIKNSLSKSIKVLSSKNLDFANNEVKQNFNKNRKVTIDYTKTLKSNNNMVNKKTIIIKSPIKLNSLEVKNENNILNDSDIYDYIKTASLNNGFSNFNSIKINHLKGNKNAFNYNSSEDNQFPDGFRLKSQKNNFKQNSEKNLNTNKRISRNTIKNFKIPIIKLKIEKHNIDNIDIKPEKPEKPENIVYSHHKKSIINDYFERKETDKHLKNMFVNINHENKEEIKLSKQLKIKIEKDGCFMLKKDYFIQNLIEKGTNPSLKNFIKDLNQNNCKGDSLLNGNINFSKIKIENEIEKKENRASSCNLRHRKNYESSTTNRFELKTSKKASGESCIIDMKEKHIDPNIVKDTFDIKNFSKLKIFTKLPQKRNYENRKKESSKSISSNNSNLNLLEEETFKRYSGSALRNNIMQSSIKNDNSDEKTNKTEKKDIDKENIPNIYHIEKINEEGKPSRCKDISFSTNNKFTKQLVSKQGSMKLDNSSHVFNFDKSSKLNYYHARELSGFTRNKKNNLISNLDNDNENSRYFSSKNPIIGSLNLNIVNCKSEKLKKNLNFKIIPTIINNKEIDIENKIFHNEVINDSILKDKPFKSEFNGKKEKNNFEILQNNEKVNKKIRKLSGLDIESKSDSPNKTDVFIKEKNFNERKHERKNENFQENSTIPVINTFDPNFKDNTKNFKNFNKSMYSMDKIKNKKIYLEKFTLINNNRDLNYNNFSKTKSIFSNDKNTIYDINSNEKNNNEILNNSITQNINNEIINPYIVKSLNTNLDSNYKTNEKKEINIINNEEIGDSNKFNKEKDVLNELIKTNIYLDSDQFNYNLTNEVINVNEDKELKSISNEKKLKRREINVTKPIDKMRNLSVTKKDIKSYEDFQSNFNSISNNNIDKMNKKKFRIVDKSNSRKIYSSYNQSIPYPEKFDLNEFFFSQNIDYKNIVNFNHLYKIVPKSTVGFSNTFKKETINKPPPNSFKNVFTPRKIQLNSMIFTSDDI